MEPADPPRPSLARRAARAAVLLSSGSLAAVLVLRSGGSTGCDGPSSPPEKKSAPAASSEPAPKSVTPPTALGPAAAPEPAPAPAPAPAPDPAGLLLDPAGNAGNAGNANNAGPRYFPASKAGVFIERDAPQEPPAKEPPAQSPAQQAGPR